MSGVRGSGEGPTLELDIEDAYDFADDEKPTIAIEFPQDQNVIRSGYQIYQAGAPYGSSPAARGTFSQITEVRWEASLSPITPGEYRIVAGIDEDGSEPGTEGRFDVFPPIPE